MADQEMQKIQDPLEETWEERTLNLLYDSKIDQAFSAAKMGKKRRSRSHSVKRMMKKPMAIPEVILELQLEYSRESALRCLSNFLLEKREDDPENYCRTGCMLYFSCSTMTLLLQEVQIFLALMADDFLTVRSCNRLINVLTLFQCIAANNETRHKFVESGIPNFLVPLLLFKTSLEKFENVRVVALSVFGILCQAREPKIIQWALRSNLVETSCIVLEIGNELSKVIGMHIIEAILKHDMGKSYICSPYNDCLLARLTRTWDHLITLLAMDLEFSPRLLFHIVRCYVLLCTDSRGTNAVRENLSSHFVDGSFDDAIEEFPIIKSLVEQLLLTVGRTQDTCFLSLPEDEIFYEPNL
ncbi:hypothetical protein ACH5RR_006495 [Cinchona calisaya]|uniref:Cell differentiation protein rcd1 n=1 Tax=Cinchona calisaya TaxID=153742 RepID=A0ABD3AP77_9GENT